MNNLFKLAIFGFSIVLLLMVSHYVSWLNPVENFIVKTVSPIQEGFYSISTNSKNFHSRWIEKRDLLKENEEIRRELAELYIKQSKVNSLEEQNELLKKELDFVREEDINTVAAKIITGVSDELSKSVVINRGSNDNIEKGMAVVAEDGVMIGKIWEVHTDYSKVLLLTDNKSKVAATIQNTDRTTGLIEGQFGLSFAMTNIPQDQEVYEGDLIVTSGLEGKIPKDLLIAKVDSVNQVESEIFKTALLTPIISLDNLSYVLVIVP